MVRGFRVDLTDSVHGLHVLADETALLATPEPHGAEITRYGPGTEVAIIGTARGRDHYYVSPCNACEKGFVVKSAVPVEVLSPG